MSSLRYIFLLLVCVLGGCAQSPGAGETEVRYGRVTRVDYVQVNTQRKFGLGTVLGAVAGTAIGHQIGSGGGTDAAMVAGGLLGAYAGSEAESRLDTRPGQQVFITLKDGEKLSIVQPGTDLRAGDLVRITGDGSDARAARDEW